MIAGASSLTQTKACHTRFGPCTLLSLLCYVSGLTACVAVVSISYARVCSGLEEVRRDRGPKVILASHADQDIGFAKDLFMEWCGNPYNLVSMGVCIMLSS